MGKKRMVFGVMAIVFLAVSSGMSLLSADSADRIDIPYQKFVLENGLTLIVHEDHKAPIVAFNIWYHVGSKNEKPGKTGFAHLFEHLMFNGSEHYNDDYFKPMQKVGATDMNGTTNEDRTNYFENVPTSALDLVLWMESDRMGYLQGAISQARLDEQRGVVQNEKRQYDNEPYSIADELIAKAVFPAGHPYSWTVIGSLEDLQAAKLEDVHNWFGTYYGPNNAVISIAGDIDTQTVLQKVKQYFGHILPGPPIGSQQAWIAKRSGEQRQSVQDRVPQARLFKVWNVPQWSSAESDALSLAARVLGNGKISRLYKRLVYDDQIATRVAVYVDSREIAGLFTIEADAKPGVDLSRVESAVNEELKRFLAEGPTEKELERVKTQYLAQFIGNCERIGGFGGKSDILVQNQVMAGSPDYYKAMLKNIANATPQNVKDAAARWLADGVYTLEVRPYPPLSASGKDSMDRSKLPEAGPAPLAKFPAIQRSTLANGLKVILAERHSVPFVYFTLVLDAGFAADQSGIPGTSTLAMNMLSEGTARRTSLQISEELALLGAQLGATNNLDASIVTLRTLKDKLDLALDIYADVIANPAFPENDFRRLQKLQIAQIQMEKSSPMQMALRVLPRFVYGSGHAYGNPLTGTGFESTIAKLTRQDLVNFHKTWFKPNHATLLVVGDTSLAEIQPKLEKLFKGWSKGSVPTKNIASVKPFPSAVYLMDKPDAPQSIVIAGHVAPPSADPDRIAIELVNRILGGDFVSRINMNIREDKHWSYGARTMIPGARGQRLFFAFAPVQADKTKETIAEIQKEFEGIVGKKPITADEFANVKKATVLQLAGLWETMRAVNASLAETVFFGLAQDYWQSYATKVQQLEMKDLAQAAKKTVCPGNIIWVIVGDRAKVEPKIRELGFEKIIRIDGDGNVIP